MKKEQARFLLSVFGISASLALIGMALSIFGWASETPWILYSGIITSVASLAVLIYAKRALKNTLEKNYEELTSSIDSKMSEAKATLDRIYKKRSVEISDQNTKPGNSPEQ